MCVQAAYEYVLAHSADAISRTMTTPIYLLSSVPKYDHSIVRTQYMDIDLVRNEAQAENLR